MRAIISFLFASLVMAAVSPFAAAQNSVEVFEIGYGSAPQIAGAVKLIMGPSGKMSVDASSNRIIVSDSPANIEKIRELVTRLDRTPRNIMVTVEFVEENEYRRARGDINWEARGDGWMIGSGGPRDMAGQGGSVQLDVSAAKGGYKSNRKQFLRLMENTPGRIFAGESVPFTNYFIRRGGNYGYVESQTTFKNAGASFSVTARKLDDGKIMLSLAPEVSHYDRRQGIFEVKNAATSVAVDDPGTVVIGGDSAQSESFGANFLRGIGGGNAESGFVMVISVKSE